MSRECINSKVSRNGNEVKLVSVDFGSSYIVTVKCPGFIAREIFDTDVYNDAEKLFDYLSR